MATFNISNQTSGADLGNYEGDTVEHAVDAFFRDAGYADTSDYCKSFGFSVEDCLSDLVVTALA